MELYSKDQRKGSSDRNLICNKQKHFLEFLFGSNLMQDVAYGTTVIKFDSGEKQVLPHAVLTAMRSRVVQNYKQHCKEIILFRKMNFF